MSLFKKKENEFSTGKKRPKLKPIGGAQEKAGTSGKGGGEPAKPSYDVNSKGWSDQLASFKKKGGRNNDGAFGYGYVDENTGIEVPWYIDMINGGGANAAGDTFVSPFAELPLGGGMLSMPSNLANAANIAPYGSNQPRHFMPMEAARVDAEGKPVQVDLGPAPASIISGGGNGGSSASNYTGERSKSLFDFGAGFDRAGPSYAPAQPYSTMSFGEAGRMPPLPSAAGPTNTTVTTPDMDFMYNMAKQTVMSRFPTMPPQEQELKAQEEYNRLMYAMGM